MSLTTRSFIENSILMAKLDAPVRSGKTYIKPDAAPTSWAYTGDFTDVSEDVFQASKAWHAKYVQSLEDMNREMQETDRKCAEHIANVRTMFTPPPKRSLWNRIWKRGAA